MLVRQTKCVLGIVSAVSFAFAHGWAFLSAATPAAEAVQVMKTGESYQVRTDVYAARVDKAGSLESLVIEGVEFMARPTPLRPGGAVVPAVYACYMNECFAPYKMPGGTTCHGKVVFEGSPYVWHTPQVKAETPVTLSAAETAKTVNLPIRPAKPGHYTGKISIVTDKGPIYSKRVGFLYRPEEIPPAQAPADFDAFWDKTLAELDKIPLDMTLVPQKDKETPQGWTYKVKYRSWGGRWAWAWLYVPKAAGKFPAMVRCPPVSVYQPGQAQPANGELWIAAAIHGGDLKDYPAKPDFDYMNTGITSRETYMLRYSYCCLARCFDIIKNHPKCNGKVAVAGGSQGAGLSLVMAGIRPVKSASGIAVALCRIDWTVLGYAQWGPSCPSGQDPKKIAEVVRYFDPASFAHRIHAPIKLCLGLFDFCAPAEGIFTAINALPKKTHCEVFVDPYGGHFSLDGSRVQGPGLEVPRWQGTAKENKLAR